jgi:hypothetical protein
VGGSYTTHSRGRKLDTVSMTHERLTRGTDKTHDDDTDHTTLSTSEKVNDIIATADSWVTQSYLP